MTRYSNREDNKRAAGMSRAAKVAAFVGSFLGAFLLWIYAIGYDSTLFDRTFSGVEIEIVGADVLSATKHYTLAQGQEFPAINVVAKGKRSQLNELSAEDFKAVVDVSKISRAGDQTVEITVIAPNGINVESQSLTTVTMFVDEFTIAPDKSVEIDIIDGYVLEEGLKIDSKTAYPSTVSVSGPKSVIDKIAGVYVKCSFDDVITQSREAHGNIELRDAQGNVINNPYISLSETEADVFITVKKQKEITLEVELVGGVYNTEDISGISVYPTTITVSGSPEALEKIPDGKLVISIDETEKGWGTHFIERSINQLLPDGVTNESEISKAVITLPLPELSVRNYTIKAENISVESLPDGKTYEILSDWDVTFIGPRDAFNGFDFSLVSATINFSGVVNFEADGYSAEPIINFGAEHHGIFVQNKHDVVKFRVFDETVVPDTPDDPNGPGDVVNPNDVIEPASIIDPNQINDNDIL